MESRRNVLVIGLVAAVMRCSPMLFEFLVGLVGVLEDVHPETNVTQRKENYFKFVAIFFFLL